jgi:hypothetical protein
MLSFLTPRLILLQNMQFYAEFLLFYRSFPLVEAAIVLFIRSLFSDRSLLARVIVTDDFSFYVMRLTIQSFYFRRGAFLCIFKGVFFKEKILSEDNPESVA